MNLSNTISKVNAYLWRFSIVVIFLAAGLTGYSQNCTINAGVDQTVCPGVAVSLVGTTSGLFQGGTASVTWTQISGPSATITSPHTLSTTVTGCTSDNLSDYIYKFQLSTTCLDGTLIYDVVQITVKKLTQANAGIAQTYCPGSHSLAANSAGTGETGAWSIPGTNNGVTVTTASSATSAITISTTKSGATSLLWTITNTTSLCTSVGTVVITDQGGVTPVSAGTNQTLSACYSSTTQATMAGSYAGTGVSGQAGLWTMITGPSNPTITANTSNTTTITNLTQGIYTLRWTVSGGCVSGNSTVNITVPAPSGANTTATISSGSQTFCDTRTQTVLTGSIPTYANESVTWTQSSGPACTILNPNSTTTAITGLSTAGTYKFTYQIVNSSTGCGSTSAANTIAFATAPSITITSTPHVVLAANATTSTVTYTTSGGNATQYAIVTNPSGAVTPAWASAGATSQAVSGLSSIGEYTIRFRRYTTSGTGVCSEADADVNIYVSKTPTASNAGTNQLVACNVTSTSLAGNPPSVGTGIWYQVSGPNTATIANPSLNTSGISGLINGVYDFRWSISAGINSPRAEKDVLVTVATTAPTVSNAGSPQTVCYNTPIALSGNTPALNETGVWSVSPSTGVTISNSNSPTPVVTGMAQSTAYTFTWRISNTCSTGTPSTVTITTTSAQGPVQSNAGANQCLASGTTTATMAGNDPSPGAGVWSKFSGPSCTITTPSSRNSTVTGMTNGTYLFIWTLSYNGCVTNQSSVQITISAAATTSAAGSSQNICGTTATLAANTPTVGTGTWSQLTGPGIATISSLTDPNASLSNLVAGNYTFAWIISNNACASNSSNVSIFVGVPPTTANAGADQYVCPPTTTATLAGNTITNGIGYWDYISGPSVPTFSNSMLPTSTLSGLTSGTYTLQWTAMNGPFCSSSTSLTHVFFTPVIGSLATQNLCSANTILLTGTASTNGSWTLSTGNSCTITTTGGNTAEVDGLSAGTYVFTYTIPANGSCSVQTANETVVNSALPTTPIAGSDQSFCNAASFTLAGNTISVGTGTWTKSTGPGNAGTFSNTNNHSPGATFTPQAGNTTGTFIMNWTVVNGNCSAIDQMRIDNYGLPTASNAGTNQTNVCGLTTSLAGNTPTNGLGTWSFVSGPETPVIDAPVTPTSLLSWDASGSGTYTMRWTISNGSCTPSSSTVNITSNTSAPTTPTVGADQPNVCGTSAVLSGNSITVGTGSWQFISGPNTPTFTNINNPLTSVTGLVTGTYTFKWTSTNSCGTFLSPVLTITVNPAETTSNAGTDQTSVCYPATVTLNANNPTNGTGTWSQISGPSTATIMSVNAYNSTVIGTEPGTYTFQWTITNVCGSSSSNVNITINDIPTQPIAGAYQNICNGTSATLAGNSPTTGTGTWTLVSGPNSPVITSPNAPGSTITGLIAGTYTMQWTIANGTCTASDATLVEIDALPTTANAGANQNLCTVTTATMAANTPITGTGAWSKVSGPNTPTFTTASSPTTNVTGMTGGTYVLRWTITNGACTSTSDVTVKHPSAVLSASITGHTNVSSFLGNNGSATASASGGTSPYSYSWNTSPVQTTTTASTLTAGTYTVTVTDNFGCTSNASIAITQPSGPLTVSIPSYTNVSCYGGSNGSATTSAAGGTSPYSYQWSDISHQTTATASSLSSGIYTVTITDFLSNTQTANVTITQPSSSVSSSITSHTNILCYNGNTGAATVSASGGTSPYNYQWSDAGHQTTSTASSLYSGIYSVTVSDNNGCNNISTVTITQPSSALSSFVTSQTDVACYGNSTGAATVTASGGTSPFNYQWSDVSHQTNATASLLTSGIYTVTVSDNNGCNNTSTVTITQPSSVLSSSVTSQTDVSCYGNSNATVTVTSTGGTSPYSYHWSDVSHQTNATASSLSAGLFTVTVTDNNNCITSTSVTITQPTLLYASITSHFDVSVSGGSDGSATIAASGGTSGYSYLWNTSPVQTNATANSLYAGTYTVTVTDANNCTAINQAVIADPTELTLGVWTAKDGTTEWDDPLNWSGNTVPTSTMNVTIPTHPSGGEIFPDIINDVQFNDIDINTGASLNIPSGKTILVYGNFSNNGSHNLGSGTISFNGTSPQTISGYNRFADLIIDNPGGVTLTGTTEISDALSPTTGTLTTNDKLVLLANTGNTAIITGDGTGNVSGNVTVQKQFLDYNRYYYFSAPVSCTMGQVQNYEPITGWGASYQLNQWSNLWYYDETSTSQVPHPDGVWMNGWVSPTSSSVPFQALRGYALYVTPGTIPTLNFYGAIHDGQVTYPVTHTSSVSAGGLSGQDGWNLIGNPYPCPIDWDASSGWIKNNVDDAIYFYVANTYGGSYKSYVNGIGVPSNVTGIIAPMQGFMIHASANGSITSTNSTRVNAILNYNKKATKGKELIRLRAYNKDIPDATDEAVVYFSDTCKSFKFNSSLDAIKIMNSGVNYPTLFSIVDVNTRLTTYGIPAMADSVVNIPLGFEAGVTGSFIINATQINNIDASTGIYLVDKQNSIVQDLRQNPIYNFDINQGITEGRFYLRFNSVATDIIKISENEMFNSYVSNKILNISYFNVNNKYGTLNICNLLGQDVINTAKVNNGNYSYSLANGTYLVRLISNNKTYVKKVIVE